MDRNLLYVSKAHLGLLLKRDMISTFIYLEEFGVIIKQVNWLSKLLYHQLFVDAKV